MKLHLRRLRARGTTQQLVTLRPFTDVSFSTNYFHGTWHILSDCRGARLLGRLLWGLTFQSKSNTAILLHGEHITPTPFGAEPSNPVLLFVAGQFSTNHDHLRRLRSRLSRLGQPERTVRWKTHGLDSEIRGSQSSAREMTREIEPSELYHKDNDALWKQEQMFRRGGIICYTAPVAIMRMRAVAIAKMAPIWAGMDYYYLAENRESHWWPDGEVQIFNDYIERKSAAAEARSSVLSTRRKYDTPEQLYEIVARKREQVLARRRAARRATEQRQNRSRRRRKFRAPSRPALSMTLGA